MNGIRRDELDREICGFQARGGIAAVAGSFSGLYGISLCHCYATSTVLFLIRE